MPFDRGKCPEKQAGLRDTPQNRLQTVSSEDKFSASPSNSQTPRKSTKPQEKNSKSFISSLLSKISSKKLSRDNKLTKVSFSVENPDECSIKSTQKYLEKRLKENSKDKSSNIYCDRKKENSNKQIESILRSSSYVEGTIRDVSDVTTLETQKKSSLLSSFPKIWHRRVSRDIPKVFNSTKNTDDCVEKSREENLQEKSSKDYCDKKKEDFYYSNKLPLSFPSSSNDEGTLADVVDVTHLETQGKHFFASLFSKVLLRKLSSDIQNPKLSSLAQEPDESTLPSSQKISEECQKDNLKGKSSNIYCDKKKEDLNYNNPLTPFPSSSHNEGVFEDGGDGTTLETPKKLFSQSLFPKVWQRKLSSVNKPPIVSYSAQNSDELSFSSPHNFSEESHKDNMKEKLSNIYCDKKKEDLNYNNPLPPSFPSSSHDESTLNDVIDGTILETQKKLFSQSLIPKVWQSKLSSVNKLPKVSHLARSPDEFSLTSSQKSLEKCQKDKLEEQSSNIYCDNKEQNLNSERQLRHPIPSSSHDEDTFRDVVDCTSLKTPEKIYFPLIPSKVSPRKLSIDNKPPIVSYSAQNPDLYPLPSPQNSSEESQKDNLKEKLSNIYCDKKEENLGSDKQLKYYIHSSADEEDTLVDVVNVTTIESQEKPHIPQVLDDSFFTRFKHSTSHFVSCLSPNFPTIRRTRKKVEFRKSKNFIDDNQVSINIEENIKETDVEQRKGSSSAGRDIKSETATTHLGSNGHSPSPNFNFADIVEEVQLSTEVWGQGQVKEIGQHSFHASKFDRKSFGRKAIRDYQKEKQRHLLSHAKLIQDIEVLRNMRNFKPKIRSPSGVEDSNQNSFVNESLRAHNLYRARHSSPPLILSENLRLLAQEWANRLAQTELLHQKTNAKYGQNIFCRNVALEMKTRQAIPDISGEELSAYWYSDVRRYSFNLGDTALHAHAGSFSQMVWKESKYFGIGKALSRSGKLIVVANYYPAGNIANAFRQNILPLNTRALASEILGRNRALLMSASSRNDSEKETRLHQALEEAGMCVSSVLAAQPPNITGRNATKILAARMLGFTSTVVTTPDKKLEVVVLPRKKDLRKEKSTATITQGIKMIETMQLDELPYCPDEETLKQTNYPEPSASEKRQKLKDSKNVRFKFRKARSAIQSKYNSNIFSKNRSILKKFSISSPHSSDQAAGDVFQDEPQITSLNHELDCTYIDASIEVEDDNQEVLRR